MKKTLIAASLLGLTLIGATFASMTTQATVTTQGTVEENAMVTRAHNASITKYTTWSNFMPNATVTREQAAKMIVMWMNGNSNIQVEMNNNTCTFKDESQIDQSLTDWVRTACQYGLFQGYKGNFMPMNKISTNDIATVVERLSAKSPVIAKYTAMIKIKVADRPLLRGELLKGLHTLDVYVKQQAVEAQAAEHELAQNTLNSAKMLWAKQTLITYTLTQKASCFCAPEYTRPIKYSVISNSVYASGAMYADGSGGAASGTMMPKLHTVDDAFGMIQNALDNNADSVNVQYDSILGYPTSISIDRSRMIADEEQYFTFSLTK